MHGLKAGWFWDVGGEVGWRGWVSMGGYLWVGVEIYVGEESCGGLVEKESGEWVF